MGHITGSQHHRRHSSGSASVSSHMSSQASAGSESSVWSVLPKQVSGGGPRASNPYAGHQQAGNGVASREDARRQEYFARQEAAAAIKRRVEADLGRDSRNVTSAREAEGRYGKPSSGSSGSDRAALVRATGARAREEEQARRERQILEAHERLRQEKRDLQAKISQSQDEEKKTGGEAWDVEFDDLPDELHRPPSKEATPRARPRGVALEVIVNDGDSRMRSRSSSQSKSCRSEGRKRWGSGATPEHESTPQWANDEGRAGTPLTARSAGHEPRSSSASVKQRRRWFSGSRDPEEAEGLGKLQPLGCEQRRVKKEDARQQAREAFRAMRKRRDSLQQRRGSDSGGSDAKGTGSGKRGGAGIGALSNLKERHLAEGRALPHPKGGSPPHPMAREASEISEDLEMTDEMDE
ncbi:unnamed protein product [Chrysoparadoxa australica]